MKRPNYLYNPLGTYYAIGYIHKEKDPFDRPSSISYATQYENGKKSGYRLIFKNDNPERIECIESYKDDKCMYAQMLDYSTENNEVKMLPFDIERKQKNFVFVKKREVILSPEQQLALDEDKKYWNNFLILDEKFYDRNTGLPFSGKLTINNGEVGEEQTVLHCNEGNINTDFAVNITSIELKFLKLNDAGFYETTINKNFDESNKTQYRTYKKGINLYGPSVTEDNTNFNSGNIDLQNILTTITFFETPEEEYHQIMGNIVKNKQFMPAVDPVNHL